MCIYGEYHTAGTIEHYKAMLVAKRLTQTYGVNYLETFAQLLR